MFVKSKLFCVGEAVVTGIGASGSSLPGPTVDVVVCPSNNGTYISKKPNIAFEEERTHDRNDTCIGFSPLADAAGFPGSILAATGTLVAATTKGSAG